MGVGPHDRLNIGIGAPSIDGLQEMIGVRFATRQLRPTLHDVNLIAFFLVLENELEIRVERIGPKGIRTEEECFHSTYRLGGSLNRTRVLLDESQQIRAFKPVGIVVAPIRKGFRHRFSRRWIRSAPKRMGRFDEEMVVEFQSMSSFIFGE